MMHRALLPAVSLFLAACTSHYVLVTDPSGNPISGAKVVAVSLSMNSAPAITDARGKATVPALVQDAQWIAVSKPGYEAVQLEISRHSPIRVTLDPAPGP